MVRNCSKLPPSVCTIVIKINLSSSVVHNAKRKMRRGCSSFFLKDIFFFHSHVTIAILLLSLLLLTTLLGLYR